MYDWRGFEGMRSKNNQKLLEKTNFGPPDSASRLGHAGERGCGANSPRVKNTEAKYAGNTDVGVQLKDGKEVRSKDYHPPAYTE